MHPTPELLSSCPARDYAPVVTTTVASAKAASSISVSSSGATSSSSPRARERGAPDVYVEDSASTLSPALTCSRPLGLAASAVYPPPPLSLAYLRQRLRLLTHNLLLTHTLQCALSRARGNASCVRNHLYVSNSILLSHETAFPAPPGRCYGRPRAVVR